VSAEVDAYLAALPRPDQRAALQSLREIIRRRLPDHIECLSYAMPGFRQPGKKGRMVAGYAAFAVNCGYYPHSGNFIPRFAADLAPWKTTPCAVQFTPDHSLPEALVQRLIDARLAEIAATGR
jgi:uncharacterized protein YdhG (YjbR/CyaY superfamily)